VLDDPVVISNSTFIVNDEDVVVVDSGISDSSARVIIEEIRKRTDKPVSVVINTHWHDDHVLGNRAFRAAWPGAEFLGHTATREDFLKIDVPMLEQGLTQVPKIIEELQGKEQTPARVKAIERMRGLQAVYSETAGKYLPPTLLVNGDTTLARGSRKIEIRFLGLGNTRGDLVVWLPQERIAISGDLAITPSPFALGSNISDWLVTLDRLAALDPAVYVSGHGPVQREKTFIADLQTMLRSIRDQVYAGAKHGKTLEELKKSVAVTPRQGSVYEHAPEHPFFEMYFRQPAIERSFEETKK
jgi:cyclase